MSKLTRKVIIEKFKYINPTFPNTMKGLRNSYYFFECIGGIDLYFFGIKHPNMKWTLERANEIWHQLNHHTLKKVKTMAKKD